MKIIVTIVIIVIPFSSLAQNKKVVDELESWYLWFNVGLSFFETPPEISEIRLYSKENLRNGISGDFIGVYLPLSRQTALGINLNWLIQIEGSEGLGTYDLFAPMCSISAIHFLSEKIGQGLFFRFDAGVSDISAKSTSIGMPGPDIKRSLNDVGFGGLIGFGYAIPISPGKRVLFSMNYAIRHHEFEPMSKRNIKSLSVCFGLLI